MKKILLTAMLLISFNTYATDLGEIDPTVIGQETLNLTCTKPIQYEDNTDIAIGESVDIQWKVDINGENTFADNVGVAMPTCSQTIDLTSVPDNVYVYKAVAIARGKTSALSAEFVKITVKRLPNPKQVTGVTGALS